MAFQAIAIQAGITLGLWALNKWVFNDKEQLPRPRPEGMDFAQTKIGAPVPLVYGTVRIDNAVLVRLFNHRNPVFDTTVGAWRYGCSMLLVLGTPPGRHAGIPSFSNPSLKRVWYGNTEATILGNSPTGVDVSHTQFRHVTVDLGGAGAGGTFTATVQFFDGRTDQLITNYPGLPDDGLTAPDEIAENQCLVDAALVRAGADRSLTPGYRRQMLLYVNAEPSADMELTLPPGNSNPTFRAFRSTGESPNVQNISVEVTAHLPDGGAAWIIYDLLVENAAKLGISPDDIDLPSFQAAADVLYAEVWSYSVIVHQEEEVTRIIGSILDYIDGALYFDNETGKLVLSLVRADYDPNAAPVIDEDNTVGIPTVSVTSWDDVVSQVRVTSISRELDYQTDTVPAQRIANAIGQNNSINSRDITMPGVIEAKRFAARELNAYGRPRLTAQCKVSRAFASLKVTDVVKCNWPKRGVDNVLFRVIDVDLGQLAKGEVGLTLIQDVFGTVADDGTTTPVTINPDMFPITRRYLEEAPLFYGFFSRHDQNLRLIAAAAPEVDSTSFRVDSAVTEFVEIPGASTGTPSKGGTPPPPGGITIKVPVTSLVTDVPAAAFPVSAEVHTLYARWKEPYDTTYGLRIKNVEGNIAPLIASTPIGRSQIERYGIGLFLVCEGGYGRKSGGEWMAFEGITDNLDGTYTLTNVWRGLLDTAPAEWPVDARIYFTGVALGSAYVGARTWVDDDEVASLVRAVSGANVTTEDRRDGTTIVGRLALPTRQSDLHASGYEIAGTKGLPAVADVGLLLRGYKDVSDLDGDLALAGTSSPASVLRVIRGDSTTYQSHEDPDSKVEVFARKDGEDEVAIAAPVDAPLSARGFLLGAAGHGSIDVLAYTTLDGERCWQPAPIRVNAARYRNLLGNHSFDAPISDDGPGVSLWDLVVGTGARDGGASSLSKSGNGSWFAFLAQDGSSPAQLGQTIDVSGYKVAGLSAIVTLYRKNIDGGTGVTSVWLQQLDALGVPIQENYLGDQAAGSTMWRRYVLRYDALLATTRKLRLVVYASDNVGGESPPPPFIENVSFTRARIQLGQVTAQLLTNPSFDGNTTAGWTTPPAPYDTALTSINSAALTYATDDGSIGVVGNVPGTKCGITQSIFVVSEFAYGTLVVEFAQAAGAASTSDEEGSVILEALDGFSNVIAAASAPFLSLAATPGVWTRRRVALDLPDGTSSVRVSALAQRVGIGTIRVMFDDFDARIWKHLDASSEVEFDFSAPSRAIAPTSWQSWHLSRPAMPVPAVVWRGGATAPSVRNSTAQTGATQAWSDGIGAYGELRAHLEVDGEHVSSTSTFRFPRAAAGAAVDLQSLDGDEGGYGDWRATEPFSVVLLLQTDELVWGGACGLIGRRGASTGIGWGVSLDSVGRVVATLQGDGGVGSVTSSDAINDRSPRWIAITHDGVNLKLYTRAGSASTATGAVGNTFEAGAVLRIGRDRASSQTLPGSISRVYLFDVALSTGDAQTIVNELGGDPSGLVTTWTSNQPVWIPAAPNGSDDTLVRCAASDVPIGYSAALETSGGGYGLALTKSNTNRVQSFDVTNTSKWGPEPGTFVFDKAFVDPTGLPRGIKITQSTASAGFRVTDLVSPDLGVSYRWSTIVYLKGVSGAMSLDVQLLDSTGAVKGTVVCALTTAWKRFQIEHAWDGATPTAHLRFAVSAAGIGTYAIGHVLWSGRLPAGSVTYSPPVAIQDAGVTIGDTYAARATTLPLQLLKEGELFVEAVVPALPSGIAGFAGGTLVSVDNNANANDKRALAQLSEDVRVGALVLDSSGTPGTPTSVGVTSGTPFEARARWNRTGIPDSSGGALHEGTVANTIGAATRSYSYEERISLGSLGVALSRIRIGGGDPGGSTSPNALIRRVVVRAREEKLDGL